MFVYPTPELPDDTPIDHVRFATRIRNVLNAAGIKTVGEVRMSHIFAKRWATTAKNRPAPQQRTVGRMTFGCRTSRTGSFARHAASEALRSGVILIGTSRARSPGVFDPAWTTPFDLGIRRKTDILACPRSRVSPAYLRGNKLARRRPWRRTGPLFTVAPRRLSSKSVLRNLHRRTGNHSPQGEVNLQGFSHGFPPALYPRGQKL